jgi:hypothetical protein
MIDLCVVPITEVQLTTGHPELPQGGSEHSHHPSRTAGFFKYTPVPWSHA